MPADASIYSMIRPQQQGPGPLEQYGQVLSLKNMMGQGELHALQLEQARRDAETQGRVRDLYASGATPTDAQIMAADPIKYGPAALKSRLDTQKTTGEIEKTKAETHGLQLKQLRDQLATVQDDAGLAAVREQTAKIYGPQAASGIPLSVNDPSFAPWREKTILTADQLVARLAPKFSVQDFGGTKGVVQENPLAAGGVTGMQPKSMTPGEVATDLRTKAEGAANRGVTVRGQNLTNERAKDTADRGDWQYDAERGLQVNKRTGEARPVTQDGQPITPRDNAPEAMLKAAGYADRMKKASGLLDQFAEAGKPGVIESAAGQRAGGVPANLSRSPERQQFHQAAEDWVRAKLRQESGAVIADEEMAREIRTYFPSIGDGPEVIAQKAAARKTAEQAMVTAAGRAHKPGPAEPAAPKSFNSMPGPEKYKGKRIQADDGTIYVSNGSVWVRQ